MNTIELSKKLLALASFFLSAAGILFLCLSLFGYQKTWTLPAALGSIALSTLFGILCRRGDR